MARRPDVAKEPVQGNAICRQLDENDISLPAFRRAKGFFDA